MGRNLPSGESASWGIWSCNESSGGWRKKATFPRGSQSVFHGAVEVVVEWKRLKIRKRLLVREVMEPDTNLLSLPFMPRPCCKITIVKKVHSILRRQFFWPGMSKLVYAWTTECPACAVSKAGPEQRVPLKSISSSYQFEVVGLDYLSLGWPGDAVEHPGSRVQPQWHHQLPYLVQAYNNSIH